MGCDDYGLVVNPQHYKDHPAGIEAIEVLRHGRDYCLTQAMRYIWRVNFGHKDDDIADIKKSVWYLQDWIAEHEGKHPDDA
jgi:hypothetical protein